MATSSTPDCYSDLHSIRTQLCEKRKSEDEKLLIRFLGNNRLFEENTADVASSLILLRANEAWHINAHLHYAPKLQQLPLIKRPGTYTPWMWGHFLDLEGVITDPVLQRTHCLFLTRESAFEAWAALLIHILENIATIGENSNEKFIREKLIETEGEFTKKNKENWFPYLLDLLIYVYKNPLYKLKGTDFHETAEREINRCVKELLTKRVDSIPQSAISTLQKKCTDCLDKLDKTGIVSVPDITLIRNYLRALLYALGTAPFEHRHLGPDRLEKIQENDGAERHNLVIQGVGDLSFNTWNVAFYHEEVDEKVKEETPSADGSRQKSEEGESIRKRKKRVFLPEGEPISERKYSCLIVWKKDADREKIRNAVSAIAGTDSQNSLGASVRYDLSISQLRFMPGEQPRIRLVGDESHKLEDLVDFAIYGQLLLRAGQVVAPGRIVDEFEDVRHVFNLPNVNQGTKEFEERMEKWKNAVKDWSNDCELQLHEEKLFESAERFWKRAEQFREAESEKHIEELKRRLSDEAGAFFVRHYSELEKLLDRPRDIFGQIQNTAVWLLEHALLSDRSLRHLACTSTIAVDLAALGSSQPWITFCLLYYGYKQMKNLYDVREEGDFAWDESDRAKPRLNIRLKRNTYPCTMVGIGGNRSEGDGTYDTLFLLARGHDFKKGAHTIWECAEVMRAAGAQYALLLDEGLDVFQLHLPGKLNGKPDPSNNDDANLSNLTKYLDQEERCCSLSPWMRVPIAFNSKTGHLKRRSLRATIAFWQENQPRF